MSKVPSDNLLKIAFWPAGPAGPAAAAAAGAGAAGLPDGKTRLKPIEKDEFSYFFLLLLLLLLLVLLRGNTKALKDELV